MAEISIDGLPRTRKAALASGSKYHFTGKPCSRWHLEARVAITGRCIECSREDARARYAADPARQIRSSHARYVANRDRLCAEARAYRAANAGIIAKRKREKYAANPLKQRESASKWAKANPEAVCAIQNTRRSRKLNADGFHTGADVAEIRKLQKDRCAYCRLKLGGKGHVDHIEPLARKGSNWRRNLQILCQPCNSSKHARDPIAFAQSLGKLL